MRRLRRLRAWLTAAAMLAGCSGEGPALTPTDLTAVEPPRHEWLPETEPDAVVLALHGFNDYSNAFDEFGRFAAARGIAVIAIDQSGFGARPDAGYWAGINALSKDVRTELDRLAGRYPDVPLYLLGESMGSAVAIAAMTGPDPPEVDGIILSAPAVWGGDQMSPLYRATLWLAVQVVPNLKLTGQGLDIQASDNIEMLQALGADPLVLKGTRVRSIAGLVRLMDLGLARADELQGPLLILRGARDEIIPPDAVVAMLDRVTASPCSEIFYAEGWHLLLRDLQREVVWQDVIAWIQGERPPSLLDRPCGADLTRDAAWRSRSEAPSPEPEAPPRR
jgi:acylglycerol lipase